MSVSKQRVSKISRGSHLSFNECKAVGLEIGSMINNLSRDNDGRVHLNPLIDRVETLLGAPCRINRFVDLNSDLFEKLRIYLDLEKKEHVFVAKRGRGDNAGTWLVEIQIPRFVLFDYWPDYIPTKLIG